LSWKGKKDFRVLPDAKNAGFHALITRDRAQFNDPRECDAIKKSGLHHIRYAQRQEGMRGLALAIGAIIAAMPMVIPEIEGSSGQRLVRDHRSAEESPICLLATLSHASVLPARRSAAGPHTSAPPP
jgi:hypothetical protein